MNTSNHDIFKDRRNNLAGKSGNRVCRRKGDFGEKSSDSGDWWLKVDYISKHLTSVKKPSTPAND